MKGHSICSCFNHVSNNKCNLITFQHTRDNVFPSIRFCSYFVRNPANHGKYYVLWPLLLDKACSHRSRFTERSRLVHPEVKCLKSGIVETNYLNFPYFIRYSIITTIFFYNSLKFEWSYFQTTKGTKTDVTDIFRKSWNQCWSKSPLRLHVMTSTHHGGENCFAD